MTKYILTLLASLFIATGAQAASLLPHQSTGAPQDELDIYTDNGNGASPTCTITTTYALCRSNNNCNVQVFVSGIGRVITSYFFAIDRNDPTRTAEEICRNGGIRGLRWGGTWLAAHNHTPCLYGTTTPAPYTAPQSGPACGN